MDVADDSSEARELERQSRSGEVSLFNDLLARHRRRLRATIALRMDGRLNGRLDPSDVIQEAYLDATRRLPEYVENPRVSFYVWLRFLVMQKLAEVHRRHLGARVRTVTREAAFPSDAPPHFGIGPPGELAGDTTSPSEAVNRQQRAACLEQALASLDAKDREVIILRHFEELSNGETAEVLELSPAAAVMRHRRALARLRDVLRGLFADEDLG